MKLTDIAVKSYKPATKDKKYADGEGLYLYVTKKGAKSWRFRYRTILKKEKELVLGQYPTVSLLEARRKRSYNKQLICEGKDPVQIAKKLKDEHCLAYTNTFEPIAIAWHEKNSNKWTEKHRKQILSRLEKYIFPKLGNRIITEIKPLEILDILSLIEQTGKYDVCQRLLQYVSKVFQFAILAEKATTNPCLHLKGVLKKGMVTHRPSIHINELSELMHLLENHNTHTEYKIAVKLLLLNFMRPGELRKSEWSYINFEKKIWVLPDTLTKMRREHIIPLSEQTLLLLKELYQLTGHKKFLFPSKLFIKNPYMCENTINNLLIKLGYKERHCAHGFRSLASTTLNELKPEWKDVIETQLAHVEENEVRRAYNRAKYLPQRITLMQFWADHIDNIVHGSTKE